MFRACLEHVPLSPLRVSIILKTAVERYRQQPDARLPGARRVKDFSPRREPWDLRYQVRAPGRGERQCAFVLSPRPGARPQSARRPSAHALGYILTRCRALPVTDRFDFSTAPQFTLRVRTCFFPSACRDESQIRNEPPIAIFRIMSTAKMVQPACLICDRLRCPFAPAGFISTPGGKQCYTVRALPTVAE